jgi:energy-coupling factor transporter ATP-binding protein EcfA2
MYNFKDLLRSQLASMLSVGVGLTLVALTPVVPRAYRLPLVAGVALAGLAAQVNAKGTRSAFNRLQDIEDISDHTFQERMYREMSPNSPKLMEPEGFEDIEEPGGFLDAWQPDRLYDWREINANHHTLILGATGYGKSRLAQWLAGLLHGNVVVYDRDSEPGEWSVGRNLCDEVQQRFLSRRGLDASGLISSRSLTADLASLKLEAVRDAMEADLRLMEANYVKRSTGHYQSHGVPLTEIRIVEEYPTLQADLEPPKRPAGIKPEEWDAPEDNVAKTRWAPKLIRRGRKAFIKLILISQEAEVNAMGFEGIGNVRKAFNVVRFGEYAVSHCKSLRLDKDLEDLTIYWLRKSKRHVLVDDCPAIVPDLSVPSSPKALQEPQEPVNIHTPDSEDVNSFEAPEATADVQDDNLLTEEEIQAFTELETLMVTCEPEEPLTPVRERANKSMNGCNTISVRVSDDELEKVGDTGVSKSRWSATQKMIQEGHERNTIIKDVWGFKGRRYPIGAAVWDALVKAYGALEP